MPKATESHNVILTSITIQNVRNPNTLEITVHQSHVPLRWGEASNRRLPGTLRAVSTRTRTMTVIRQLAPFHTRFVGMGWDPGADPFPGREGITVAGRGRSPQRRGSSTRRLARALCPSYSYAHAAPCRRTRRHSIMKSSTTAEASI